ncbi:hypothetical protein JCM11491_002398 [Sporobolomyces phaffii]
MCVMNNEHAERRSSQSTQASPSLPYRSTAFSRAAWSSSSSSSLPSSPKMMHNSHPHPYPSVLQPSLAFAPPHQIAPPSSYREGDAPNPEAYAKAYDMLRQRWVGREGEIVSAGQTSAAARAHKRRLVDDSTSLRMHALRRGEDLHKSVQVGLVVRTEADEVTGPELKRSKPSSDDDDDGDDHLISFFDNPPPALPAFDDDGFRRPSLPVHPRRSHSLSPSLAAAASDASSSSGFPFPSSSRSAPVSPRKRSISQPCEPRTVLDPSTPARTAAPAPRRSGPATTSVLPHSRSAPSLSHHHDHHDHHHPIAAAVHPPAPSTTARSEALLHVVKSFEAVLACRAEGWRRLAHRKLSASSSSSAAAASASWSASCARPHPPPPPPPPSSSH